MNPLSGARAPAEAVLERRIIAAILFAIVVWVLLLSRLLYLQVVRGDEYRISSQRQSVRTQRLEATRGIIFDRNGTILVDSRPAFDVLVVPHEVPDLPHTLTRLAELAELDAGALVTRLGTPRGRARFQALPVVHDLGRDPLARIESQLWSLSGVLTRVSPVRYYPFRESLAHVLGKLGEISAAQLQQRRFAGYRPGDVIGQHGIESLFDAELRGRAGGRNLLVDAHGRELEVLGEVDPQPGRNLVLTIDQRLQQAAEAGLAETPRGGAVVALDPRTGEVRVLASLPAFDPNLFASGIDRKTWQQLRDDPGKPLRDKTLQGQYPPGSTYKVITAIAGLETGAIRPDTEIYCGGSFRLGRRRYRCWRRGGHGPMKLHRAIVQSCDVYFYQTALQVGVDKLSYYARLFGLGRPTGIELRPESSGLVPTSAWKLQRFGEPWMEGETLSVGIGQGFNLWTPIQQALAYSAIANGGRIWRPFVLKRVEDPAGGVLEERSPELVSEVAVSPETLRIVRAALRGVVADDHGTGYVMRHLPQGVEAAGKTGTAQVVALAEDPPADEEEIPVEHRDHAWFTTYVPAEDPELVVAVLVEHGGHGGSAAAPIARRVIEAWLGEGTEVHARN